MRAVCLLVSLFYTTNCLEIPIPQPRYSKETIKCITNIIEEYFTDSKIMTYVGNKAQDEDLLKAINNANMISVATKRSTSKLAIPHKAYLITARNATSFVASIGNITKESTWNPMARILIVVRDLNESDLEILFDIFLELHSNNVVIMNATDDARHLYTYNPFDNYNCGKNYDSVISFGECSQLNGTDLYPDKLITGLQNCTFKVQGNQWPPYTLLLKNDSTDTSPLRHGAEPYLLKIIGDKLGFRINVVQDFSDVNAFSTVTTDMEAIGALKALQDNEVDIVAGGMLLIPSRAAAFSYLYGHLDYTDEIRFVVKRARDVRPYKNVYLEFEGTVWLLLTLAFIIYTILVIALLNTRDRTYVVLILLGNLLLHGRTIQSRWSVKCVLILWVVFAYLVNTFYQSSLVSLTTHPAKEYQISSEEDIHYYRLQPCLSGILGSYYIESVQSVEGYDAADGCYGLMESVKTVAKSENLFTLLLYGLYQYNEHDFFDEYGNSRVTTIQKPYSKVIYAFYMYKGFPLQEVLGHKAIQLRESGLVDKVMSDMNHLQQIKYKFHQYEFKGRLAIPWLVYFLGCGISIITFFIEIMLKRRQHPKRISRRFKH